MNWIDARKQQILDEYEKRKSYECVEERAEITQKDYQYTVDDICDELNSVALIIDDIKETIEVHNKALEKSNKELLKYNKEYDNMLKELKVIVNEAKKKGFNVKVSSYLKK